ALANAANAPERRDGEWWGDKEELGCGDDRSIDHRRARSRLSCQSLFGTLRNFVRRSAETPGRTSRLQTPYAPALPRIRKPRRGLASGLLGGSMVYVHLDPPEPI